jgi:hypothetical protein
MIARPAKRVSVRRGSEGELETMATFVLDGDQVLADWESEGYRRDVEENGIRAVVHGALTRLRPADGRAFYEALDLAYWQSSMVVVTDATLEAGDGGKADPPPGTSKP